MRRKMRNTLIKIRHIRLGDKVIVRTGDDRGKQGQIININRTYGRITIEGINIVTKHLKKTTKGVPAGRVQKPQSMNVSNIQLICSNCSKPTKTAVRLIGTEKELICRLCKEPINWKEK